MEEPQRDLAGVIASLFGSEGKPSVVWSGFFAQASNHVAREHLPANVFVPHEVLSGSDFLDATDQANAIFKQLFPNEEYLPPQPSPDDIAWNAEGDEQ